MGRSGWWVVGAVGLVAAGCFVVVDDGSSGAGARVEDAARALEDTARRLAAPHEANARASEAAGNPRDALKHYAAALQALPPEGPTEKEFELRERAISIARKLDPPPAVPDEARLYFDRADVMAKTAKDEKEYVEAVSVYEKGLRIAPYASVPYYNMGLLLELAGYCGRAARVMKLYLLSSPDAADRDAVMKKVIELEVKQARSRTLEGVWLEQDVNNPWRIEIKRGPSGWEVYTTCVASPESREKCFIDNDKSGNDHILFSRTGHIPYTDRQGVSHLLLVAEHQFEVSLRDLSGDGRSLTVFMTDIDYDMDYEIACDRTRIKSTRHHTSRFVRQPAE